MAANKNIQDEFLASLCEGNQFGSVYLISGIQLKGVFTGFDERAVFLKSQSSSNEQMIYKHAIATIVPLGDAK